MNRRAAEHRNLGTLPPQLKRLCYSAMLWKNIYCGTDRYKATISEVVEYLTSSDSHPHLAHDTEVLLRQSDQEAVATHEHLPLEQCSAAQLPLPATAYHNHLLKQERFKGWLDMDLLRSLDEGLKNSIKEQQKRYSIRVIAFDKLGI